MVVKLSEISLSTLYGEWREVLFYDGQKEAMAIVMGEIKEADDVLCRIHSSCIHAHIFNSIECDCREQMAISQQLIQKEGRGIIIWLDQEGKGNGHMGLLESIPHKRKGLKQADAYIKAGFRKDARDFRTAVEILKYLQPQSVRLLTSNENKAEELRSLGISVTGIQATAL